jgi:hypothetical protein
MDLGDWESGRQAGKRMSGSEWFKSGDWALAKYSRLRAKDQRIEI